MDIKKVVDELVNKIARKEELNSSDEKKEEFNFSSENYTMREKYDAENLVVGKLEYVSSAITEFGPMVKKTAQNYIFEPIIIDGVVKYQEVFSGFIAGDGAEGYFNLPYIVDTAKLTEILEDYKEAKIPKLGMLLTLNEINSQMVKCNNKNISNKRKNKRKNKKR